MSRTKGHKIKGVKIFDIILECEVSIVNILEKISYMGHLNLRKAVFDEVGNVGVPQVKHAIARLIQQKILQKDGQQFALTDDYLSGRVKLSSVSDPLIRQKLKPRASEENEFTKLLNLISKKWSSYFKKTKKNAPTVDRNHEVYKYLVEDLPKLISKKIDKNIYKVEASTGDGYVTRTPWLAIYDLSVTDNPKDGFYVVYLFSPKMDLLYLTIGFGAYQFETKFKTRSPMIENMDRSRELFVNLFKNKLNYGVKVGKPNLYAANRTSQEWYEHCTCFMYKPYDLKELPSDNVLFDDLNKILSIYREIVLDTNSDQFETISETDYVIDHNENEIAEILDFQPIAVKRRVKENLIKKNIKSERRTKESKKIGRAGEDFVYDQEIKKLKNKPELAKLVRKHYELNEFPGFDITSYDLDGNEIFIEVKSTKMKSMTSFEITENEYQAAEKYKEKYNIYMVLNATKEIASLKNKRTIIKLNNPSNLLKNGTIKISPSVFSIDLKKHT